MEEKEEKVEIHVEDIPTEIMMYIFAFVDPVGVLRSEIVSHRWREIATSDLVWKAVHMRWFGGKRAKHKEAITWKQHCLRTFRTFRKMGLENATPYNILCWACTCGHHVILSEILRENEISMDDLDGVTGGSLPPLHRCLLSGSATCAEILVLRGANVNITDPRGQLPIGAAAQKGMLDIVEVLLRYGGGGTDFAKLLDDQKKVAGIKWQKNTKPLFHQAAYGGHLKIAQVLIERATTDSQDVKQMVNARDTRSWTPLHWAAHGGRNEMIEFLLSYGADIDIRTNKQQGWKTPLLLACETHCVSTMELLLEHGVMIDPPLRSEDNQSEPLTPMQLQRLEEQILNSGAPATQQSIFTPLHRACLANSIEEAKLLLDRGADPNWLIGNRGPLHYAVTKPNANLQFFEFMLKRGANINLQAAGPACDTPILQLLTGGLNNEKVPLLHFLLDHGALLDLGSVSTTPLHALLRYNTFTYNPMDSEEEVFELVKLFVEHGATMKLGADIDHSILKCAACKYSVRVLQYLLAQEGAEINPANQTSPLAAAFLEFGEISEHTYWGAIKEAQIPRLKENIEYLLMRGADINHKISGGIPWWYLLFRPGHTVGIKLAAELGADFDWVPPPNQPHGLTDPYLWYVLRDFYMYINFLAAGGDFNPLRDFVMTLAELGVNFDWTNSVGEDLLQLTRHHADQLFNGRDTTNLPLWLAVLEEARNLSRAVRGRKERLQQESQEKEEKEKEKEN